MPAAAKKIVWIVPSGAVDVTGEHPTSALASIRYRALIPMRELAARGHAATLLQVDTEAQLDRLQNLDGVDVVVPWKFSEAPGLFQRVIEIAHAKGAMVVYDLCDDHFDHPTHGPLYLRTCRSADVVVAATPMLAETITARTGRIANIIPEPYEGPKGAAKWGPGTERLKLLWFGHAGNLASIEGVVPKLVDYGAKRPMALTVVTFSHTDLTRQFKQFNQRHRHRLSLRYVEWSLAATWRELGATDIVVIPQDTNDRVHSAKSSNRLIESMWAGRFVVASPVPSYVEFGAWAALHEDLCAGLDWALAHQEVLESRIQGGQDYIAAHYSPEVIAGRWEEALLRPTQHL